MIIGTVDLGDNAWVTSVRRRGRRATVALTLTGPNADSLETQLRQQAAHAGKVAEIEASGEKIYQDLAPDNANRITITGSDLVDGTWLQMGYRPTQKPGVLNRWGITYELVSV